MSAISGIYTANKAYDASSEATEASTALAQQEFDYAKSLWDKYDALGAEGISDLAAFETGTKIPSWEEMVSQPMSDWDYQASDAYKAQLQQDLGELASAQNARGISSSGVAASQAADVATGLTAADYANEYNRSYGELSDAYANSLAEYSQKYDEIMNKLQIGTGASSSLTSAGESATSAQTEALQEGAEDTSAYYSGLGGVTGELASNVTSYGNAAGWWDKEES